ncbi:hypothetical protein [Neisseria elongata]|jgi:hypothetical protein|uniref:hypothetical protein n=1 Tax=Neisseria elongata TaxID=495 RepID=UPI0028D5EE66|nr:hypothetical protein [Neisseria elongata]
MFKPLMFLFLVFQLLPAAAAPDAGGCAVPVRQLDIAGIKLSEPAATLQKRFPQVMPLSEGNRHFLFFPPDSGAAFAPDIADIFLEHGGGKITGISLKYRNTETDWPALLKNLRTRFGLPQTGWDEGTFSETAVYSCRDYGIVISPLSDGNVCGAVLSVHTNPDGRP